MDTNELLVDLAIASAVVPTWQTGTDDAVDKVCNAVERALAYTETLPVGDPRRVALESRARYALDNLYHQ